MVSRARHECGSWRWGRRQIHGARSGCAVALLLSPSNATVVSESDYWQRDSTQEFVIEAVMALTTDTGISSLHNFSWPWTWNGKDAVVPSASEDDDMPPADDPVYRVRVRGTTELDLVWEIVQPHDAADHFSVSVRRKICISSLASSSQPHSSAAARIRLS